MFRNSIRQKIVGIAAGLIILAVVTSLLSMVMAGQVGHLLDELTNRYIPAYGHLARVNIRALERSLAMRRMMMAKMQAPGEDSGYESARKAFDEIEPLIKREADAARTLIDAIIADPSTPSDNAALGRLDDRIDNAVNDLLMRLNAENKTLLEQIDAKDFAAAKATTLRADALRDDFNTRIEGIRADMLAQVASAAAKVMSAQQRAIIISGVVTAIAAILGFVFAMLVGSGITRPVMRLLESTREVEAGRLDGAITITTQDEIGQLSAAFNRMIETLRHNQRIRETFGRYINPRIAEGLLEQPAIAATEGQRRVMTVMFCDMKGFTSLSEGVTPSGLVKIMNLYLSTMSAPVHAHRGIIDKYIGDAIMAYWGAPFVEEAEQTHLAALAAIDMIGQVNQLRKDLPELLGVRVIPADCDIRIGIATGEALVGSIGSEFMMSYTVLGDTVNLASRLEGANKFYGSRSLISEATAAACAATIELREIDRLVVMGQTQPVAVFEILGKKDELTPAQTELRQRYADGLAAYRERRWDDAEQAFAAALAAAPGDGPSIAMKARVAAFRQDPPAADWDGAWHPERK
ncbi:MULTISPECIES: adenylate/guanylate cyclase domain-containing protein [Bradyrhizobium]|uniref:Adenylate/guanylate cyclase domain-containing protein n=1 Tax=Bradyrhizobium brasilense TaxID=1419277 RepID=A0ABY8JNU4_9BRAD|nr:MULTISPECIES: adenylate/guanylate cyclase domain-containing protein [Bradyrhizobium]MCP1832185.1 adenylate cyclase [Bradyrhizobium sp. USDA 4545]MCP1917021.1 adenylate cyclase [Bradyrhizobium sp. USDA 4532]OMI03894.1 adenylate/guanylate cyclase domain-containing protein [Bradyrhizobium brasilense]WFU67342.1 adenylate/guanylate cyclase domain-containing protein [Bradyrhizobium brasilense]